MRIGSFVWIWGLLILYTIYIINKVPSGQRANDSEALAVRCHVAPDAKKDKYIKLLMELRF